MQDSVSLTLYLQAKGREFKSSAGQDIFKTCPFCEDEKFHFYVDPDKSVYFCHKCNAKGNAYDLRRHFNDLDNPNITSFKNAVGAKEPFKPPKGKAEQYHFDLMGNQAAFDYITGRGITLETMKHFKLGYASEASKEWVTIPYFEGDYLINVKYRTLPPAKDFKRIKDAKSTLFNADCLKGSDEVIITEGEFDAILCWQNGFTNAISGSTGCSSFAPEWIDALSGMKKVYLWYDNDDPGRKASDELANRLGIDRCYFIRLEGYKDANEYFAVNNGIELEEVAFQKPIDNIINFYESVFNLFEHEKEVSSEIQTPWSNVNKLVGAIEAGDLITLSATPKTGKTTLALNIATYNAKRGYPVLVYCLEMRPERLAKKVIESEGRIIKGNFTRELALYTAEKLIDAPLYFGYNYKNIETDVVFQTMRAAARRFGLKLIVFDNLHYLVRSLAHTSAEVGIITRKFKLLAEELRLPIILIAQPRKVEEGNIMTVNDLKDSSSIGADSDQVIILWRKKTKANLANATGQETSFEPKTLVRVDASRFQSGGDTVLWCKGEYSRFEEMQYGG